MREPVELDVELVRLARERAHREGTSVEELLERTLRAHLPALPTQTKQAVSDDYRLGARLKLIRGRLQPGVDLDDAKGLRDLMDGIE